MKNNSKKYEGFTLIEIVISMAILVIISIGVYDGYMIIIKQTKAGQVKQTAALVGKQISEQIKSASENKEINISESILNLTDKIHFTKDGNEKYKSTPLYFNEDGNLVNNNYRYTAEVNLVPKKTKGGADIAIDEVSNDENTDYNVYIINENGESKAVHTKPTTFSDIGGDKVITIDIEKNNSDNCKIKIEPKDSIGSKDSYDIEHTFNNQRINIDLKYCTGEVTIDVSNKTNTPLNLCIWNNNNAKVENIKGVLNEYYRSESGSKIGTLYDVNITVFDEKSDKSKSVFETSFTQNINIK